MAQKVASSSSPLAQSGGSYASQTYSVRMHAPSLGHCHSPSAHEDAVGRVALLHSSEHNVGHTSATIAFVHNSCVKSVPQFASVSGTHAERDVEIPTVVGVAVKVGVVGVGNRIGVSDFETNPTKVENILVVLL